MTTNEQPGAAVLRAQLELDLLAVWQAVLEIADIGTDDDFFAIGGHSLLSLELREAVRKTLQLPQLAVDPLQTPTVTAMAADILAQLGAGERA